MLPPTSWSSQRPFLPTLSSPVFFSPAHRSHSQSNGPVSIPSTRPLHTPLGESVHLLGAQPTHADRSPSVVSLRAGKPCRLSPTHAFHLHTLYRSLFPRVPTRLVSTPHLTHRASIAFDIHGQGYRAEHTDRNSHCCYVKRQFASG